MPGEEKKFDKIYELLSNIAKRFFKSSKKQINLILRVEENFKYSSKNLETNAFHSHLSDAFGVSCYYVYRAFYKVVPEKPMYYQNYKYSKIF